MLKKAGLLLVLITLSACSMEEHSYMNEALPVVIEYNQNTIIDAMAWDSDVAGAIARHYSKHGKGPLTIAMTYDPFMGEDFALAQEIEDDMRRLGVEANVEQLPVVDGRSSLYVSYEYVDVAPPPECGEMPLHGYNAPMGVRDYDKNVENYRVGCQYQHELVKQIARPRDLVVSDDMGPSDARRTANVIDGGYRTGEPNEEINDLSARSELGN